MLEGLNTVFQKNDAAIVIEDDLKISSRFIPYMCRSLYKYKNKKKVCQISGFAPSMKDLKLKKHFFLPVTTSWGWGTWKSRWLPFIKYLKTEFKPDKLKVERKKFNLNNNYNFQKILDKQYAKSWGICWYYFNYLNKNLVLYPSHSHVFNAGFKADATNSRFSIIEQDNIEVNQGKRKSGYPMQIKIHKKKNEIYKKFKPKIQIRNILYFLWNLAK